jgi:hypothetical protein
MLSSKYKCHQKPDSGYRKPETGLSRIEIFCLLPHPSSETSQIRETNPAAPQYEVSLLKFPLQCDHLAAFGNYDWIKDGIKVS